MTKPTVAILHYASPPGIGGVESMIAHHTRGLAREGYPVRIVSGTGGPVDGAAQTHINPLFGSGHPDILRVKAELDAGQVTPAFHELVERLQAALDEALDGCAACVAHNIPTLNKNLPLTAALARYAAAHPIRLIAFCHDLAWTNPQYQPELHEGYPWNLLREAWPGAVYVTVSEMRRAEMAALLNVPPDTIHLCTPGIDPARFYRWTPVTERLAGELGWMDANGLLLVPARLTRRKNIALALRILAALRGQSGRDFRLIVTGPPGPHNPANPGYLGELLDLRRQLGLDSSAHFLYACGDRPDEPLMIDDDTMSDLYALADGLLFPSLQEGFGIPVLEAGLAGLPVFCTDIPPLRETGGDDLTTFHPDEPPDAIAGRILAVLDGHAPYHLRVRARQQYRWDSLIRNSLIPLLAGER